jgi:hypothetical protein
MDKISKLNKMNPVVLCNRRNFLRWMATFSLFGIAPLSALGASIQLGNHHIIGLGSSAAHILEYFSKQEPQLKFTLLDTEKHEVLLPVRVLQLDADGMRTEKLFQLFHKLFSRHGHYVLVVALGGNNGTTLFNALTAWLQTQTQKQNWDAIASLPFAFEGHHSRQMAENAIAEANKQQNIHIFELESIRLQYGHLLMEKAMEKADGRFCEVYGRMGQS